MHATAAVAVHGADISRIADEEGVHESGEAGGDEGALCGGQMRAEGVVEAEEIAVEVEDGAVWFRGGVGEDVRGQEGAVEHVDNPGTDVKVEG